MPSNHEIGRPYLNLGDDWELNIRTLIEKGGGTDVDLECVPDCDPNDQDGPSTRASLSKPGIHPQSERQEYGWRAFCFELLCGVAAIVWYVFSLAERVALKGLTRLEEIAASRPKGYLEREKASHVLFHDELRPQGATRANSHDIGLRIGDFPK